jgi:hypothetical protein
VLDVLDSPKQLQVVRTWKITDSEEKGYLGFPQHLASLRSLETRVYRDKYPAYPIDGKRNDNPVQSIGSPYRYPVAHLYSGSNEGTFHKTN